MAIIMSYFSEMWQLAIEGEAQGVFFYAALYILVVCLYSFIRQIQTRYWPFVEGEIIDIAVEKFGATDQIRANQDYISKALYKYQISGVIYDGTRISPWIFVASHNAKLILEKQLSSIQTLPNGKVKVFYNPSNPKKSFLIIAGKIGVFITLLIAISPLVLFYLKYN